MTVGNYREGYEALAKSKNESIQLAYERLYSGHLTPKEKKEYEEAQELMRDTNNFDAGEAIGKAKGKAEGIAEGEAKGKVEVARTMLAEGFDTQKVAKITGLSPKEIQDLAKSPSKK